MMSSGFLANPSGLASSAGSYLAQCPVNASRNVGMPDSALRPAPLNVAIRRALDISSRALVIAPISKEATSVLRSDVDGTFGPVVPSEFVVG
jgi:hypothetical protein